MQQVPVTDEAGVGDRVGTGDLGFCPVCLALIDSSLGGSWQTGEAVQRHLHQQVSHYDMAGFSDRTPVPIGTLPSTPTEVTATLPRGAVWKFSVSASTAGLVISNLRLGSRPGDPMADSEDVAETITFTDFGYETSGGRQNLDPADAMARHLPPPVFEIGKNTTGMLRVGVGSPCTGSPRTVDRSAPT